MLFDTLSFLLFLPSVALGYHVLPARFRGGFLLLASYVFYGVWDYRFCSLLLASTVFAYVVGIKIEAASDDVSRKRWVTLSIVANLALLGFFKYFNFFVESAATLLGSLGLQPHVASLNIVLPVGISFYTFQKISYTVDIYRRNLKPSHKPLAFALYVAFFPQLLAGPIERAGHLLPQFEQPKRATPRQFAEGAALMLLGLTKKICIADIAGHSVDAILEQPGKASALTLLVGMYLFALQIYGDFSGYSDMARGMARFFGVELMRNFQVPYAALSFKEFWSRWHISLSQWLRDYVYIPLGGNRRGPHRTRLNLVLTMLLGGLWHGANWTFVVWGAGHGACLVIEKWVETRFEKLATGGYISHVLAVLRWFVVFHTVAVLWIVFRCETLALSGKYLAGLLRGGTELDQGYKWVLAVTVPLFVLLEVPQYWSKSDLVFSRLAFWPRSAVYACMVSLVIVLWKSSYAPFIYFQF